MGYKVNWGPKHYNKGVQNLKKQELNDLPGKVITCEIHPKEDERETSKKAIALKVTQENCTLDEKELSGNDEEALSLIIH